MYIFSSKSLVSETNRHSQDFATRSTLFYLLILHFKDEHLQTLYKRAQN